MTRMYTVSFVTQTFTTALGDYDFFELTPADDRPIRLAGFSIGNKSEVGDAQDEMVGYTIVTDNATTGNGTATTPRPIDSLDVAAGFTAEVVASTPASAGVPITLLADTFNIRSGEKVILPEQFRPRISQTDVMLCIRLAEALADDAVLYGTAWVEEL